MLPLVIQDTLGLHNYKEYSITELLVTQH